MDTSAKFEISAKVLTLPNGGTNKIANDGEHINKKIKLCQDEKNNKPVITEDHQNDVKVDDLHKLESCQKQKENSDDDRDSVVYEDPEEGFIYPLEMDSSDMLDEVDLVDGYFPSVTDRYFVSYYQIDFQKPGEDFRILIHSNRICMVTLAPSHVIFEENKVIQNVTYKVSEKLDRTHNKVSGKAKHGAQPLQQNSNLCNITCSDDSSYMVKCCMIGKLIEVNLLIRDNPELLRKEPHVGGWIAILLPNLKHLDRLKGQLLTQKDYEVAIKNREQKKDVEMEYDEEKQIEEEKT